MSNELIERLKALRECAVFDLSPNEHHAKALEDAIATLSRPQPAIPEGWVPLHIEYEPGYPEDVAYGPQIMMDRLKKWLDRYFAMRLASQPADAPPVAEVPEAEWLDIPKFLRKNND